MIKAISLQKNSFAAGFACSLPLLLVLAVGCCSTKKQAAITEPIAEEEEEESPEAFFYEPTETALAFNEIWGYVMIGREKEFDAAMPISDVGYFVDAVNTYSEIRPVPPRSKHFANYKGRVHIVTSCDSTSQTHLLLDSSLPLREKIISDLIAATETYDGLQIDWENIPARDVAAFHDFLREIKRRLGDKPLSVAVKARMRTLKDDAFSYEKIAAIADRLIVMAYDEHWSTSAPGAIASTGWCKRIADYAASVIPPEKLVMGLPFYGRTWSNYKDAGRAFAAVGIERIRRENKIEEADIMREDGIPHFQYERTIGVTAYYNDNYALNCLCQLYKDCGVQQIAFWRVGQEDRSFWQMVELNEPKPAENGELE